MISLRCSDITEILNGSLHGDDVTVTSVSTDSRSIGAGELFIALKGPNFDGTAFIAEVKAKGAIAVVTEQQVSEAISQIVVQDTRLALGQLAAAVKARLAPKKRRSPMWTPPCQRHRADWISLTRVPQLEQEVKIVSEESGISSGAVYEES